MGLTTLSDAELEAWEKEAKIRTEGDSSDGIIRRRPYPKDSLGFIMSDRTIILIDALRKSRAQLRFCAGYISGTEGHTKKHPMEVLEWIEKEALGKPSEDEGNRK